MRTQDVSASGTSGPTEATQSGAAQSSRSWTWTSSRASFTGVDPDHIMWIRNAYSELEQDLRHKYQHELDTRDARSYVDSMLHKMHSFCMGTGQVATGDNLLSKWKLWMFHAVFAMSDVSDPSMSTTVGWLAPTDLNFDARKVLAILHELERKNRATKIYRSSQLQVSVLCTCPSEDSAAPPDPDAAIMIHLFGVRRHFFDRVIASTCSPRRWRVWGTSSRVTA